eukprot:4603965-Alexandrium_andersonii.AAC.1
MEGVRDVGAEKADLVGAVRPEGDGIADHVGEPRGDNALPLADQTVDQRAPEVPDDVALEGIVGAELCDEGEPVDRELVGAKLVAEAVEVLALDGPTVADHLVEDPHADADVIFGGPIVLPPLRIYRNPFHLLLSSRGFFCYSREHPSYVTGRSTPRGAPDRIQGA